MPRRKPKPLALSRCEAVVQIISNRFQLELHRKTISKFRKGPGGGTVEALGRLEGELFSRDNGQRVAVPRHLAIYVAQRVSGWSRPELGKFFRRQHTTITHSIKKARELMHADPLYQQIARDVGREVTGDRRWEP